MRSERPLRVGGRGMGIADAVRTRLALARGESLGEAIRIFLSSKEERRKIAARKFPGRGVPLGSARRPALAAVPADALAGLLDAGWYADAHGLAQADEAEAHFRTRGLAAGLAPREALAGADGRHLSGRGAELLLRLGLPVGAVAGEPWAEGRDPWGLSNPDGKGMAVVTALAEPGDRLLPVAPQWAARADFFVITGYLVDPPGLWQPVRPVFHHLDPARVAAFARAQLPTFFAAYARVLWLDPGVLCCADPAELAAGRPLACFRDEGRTPGAALAAAVSSGGEDADIAAEFLAHAGEHPAFGRAGLPDPSVLLIDPADDSVRRLMARWWRHAVRGPAEGGLALALALEEMPEVAMGELPGGALGRSPVFLRAPA